MSPLSQTSLRPYQQKAVDEIRAIYAGGTKKVLLHLATGGGKTVIFSYILKALAERGKRGLMVVHGRQLVDQAAARLERENVPHGVIMAGRPGASEKPVYVCSIDTLRARGMRPPADLIVIDEAHLAVSPSYQEFLAAYPDAFILAVTATPYTAKSMRHLAASVVSPVSIRELIATGYLVPPRYIVPVEQDLSGVAVSRATGDYEIGALSQFMGRSQIIGDVLSTWLKYGEQRPTLCFAPSIETSLKFVAECQNAGIPAAHIEAETPDLERKAVLTKLEQGSIKIVSNVGILCTGVDLPAVSCLLLYRPTKSLNLYIQQCGRGTRPHAGKNNFIIIDHGNNVREHGFIEDDHEVFLDGIPKKKSSGAPAIKVCTTCFAAVPSGTTTCPMCSQEFQVKKGSKHIDGELKEVTVDDEELKIQSYLKELRRTAKAKGYRRGWIYHQVKQKYGEAAAEKYVPKKNVPPWVLARLTRGLSTK